MRFIFIYICLVILIFGHHTTIAQIHVTYYTILTLPFVPDITTYFVCVVKSFISLAAVVPDFTGVAIYFDVVVLSFVVAVVLAVVVVVVDGGFLVVVVFVVVDGSFPVVVVVVVVAHGSVKYNITTKKKIFTLCFTAVVVVVFLVVGIKYEVMGGV